MTSATTRPRCIGVAAALAVTVLVAACGSDTPAATSTSSSAAATSSAGSTPASSSSPASSAGASATGGGGDVLGTVETMYGPLSVPKPADGELTVVALGWSDAEVALALGVKPVAVYDWLGFGEGNKGVGPWAVAEFGDVTPVVFENVDQTFPYEQIRLMDPKPDVILNVNGAPNQDAYDRLSTIAPTIFAQEGAAAFAVGDEKHVELISTALGLETEGDAIVADIESQLADARAAHPEFAGKTGVVGATFGDAFGAYLPGDFRGDLLIDLGFGLPQPVKDLESQGFFASVSAEQIGALDADVSVLFPIGYTLAELQNDELIASLQVVSDGRAVFLDPAGDEVNAFSAASPLSIPVAIDLMVPKLTDAANNVAG